jgi:hypothetical protein
LGFDLGGGDDVPQDDEDMSRFIRGRVSKEHLVDKFITGADSPMLSGAQVCETVDVWAQC